VLLFCAEHPEEMVYLVDLTTALAGLPRSLRGQWFDPALLTPAQKEAHAQVVKDTNRGIRRLFRAGLLDIGREDAYSEGFTRHHRDLVEAMQKDSYWRHRPGSKGEVPAMDVIEQHVRFHKTWAEVTDLTAAVKEMGGKAELVGLTPAGRAFVKTLSEDSP